jgi:hypothetical protein
MHRLIHFRLTLAVTGGVALALGVWLDLDWLAASGLAASAAAEALGQAAVRVAVNSRAPVGNAGLGQVSHLGDR